MIRYFPIRTPYFWATHAGAELDFLALFEGRRYGFECKCGDASGVTRSMQVALRELKLEHLFVICPGPKVYPLHEKITAVPLAQLDFCRRKIPAEATA
jgi:predicted AAA+ superfamily ATPase